jgi:hypothetical protein
LDQTRFKFQAQLMLQQFLLTKVDFQRKRIVEIIH